MSTITIDGSRGEGGGQIVRSSIALSLMTGTPIVIENIRAGRKRPGLMRQHRTAVLAAAEIGRAEVEGAEVGSNRLIFRPQTIAGGDYTYSIGTAGSTTLVLQTILLALLRADQPSKIRIEGGTHNPFAPPYDYLERVYVPLLRRMGAKIDLALERPGFYPAGGGAITIAVEPTDALVPLDLTERGELRSIGGRIWLSSLPRSIAEREVTELTQRLSLERDAIEIVEVDQPVGPGNAVHLVVESDGLVELFTAFGEHHVSSERVARNVAEEVRRYLRGEMPVGPYLADQIVLPLALTGGGAFRTTAPSRHTKTHIEVIERFLPVRIVETRVDRHQHKFEVEKV